MSAFLAMGDNETIAILTDGAVTGGGLRLVDIRRKVWTSEKVPLAVTGRGVLAQIEAAAQLVINAAEKWGFDAAIEALEDNLHLYSEGYEFELLIAGRSEKRGLEMMTFNTVGNFGEEACKLKRRSVILNANSGAASASLDEIGVGIPWRTESYAAYFKRVGVRFMQYFRDCKVEADEYVSESGYIVGGQLDLTVIGVQGVRIETLHRWNDKVGEKIDPTKDKLSISAVPAGLNRQQRRAFKRKAA